MPKTWVALLRGINVGRNKRVGMADLRGLLEGLGYRDVRTVLQSGNAVFTATDATAKAIERDVSAGIKTELGLDVGVLARSEKEWSAVVAGNPFLAKKAQETELSVVVVASGPPAKALAGVDPAEVAPDEFSAGDRVIYVRQPNGIMGSKLPDWSKVLGMTVTARNWKTTVRIQKAMEG